MDALITIGEALDRIYAHCRYDKAELSDLANAWGKTLAQDISAGVDSPAFDRAMLDGYAVRHEDIASAADGRPVLLQVAGRVPAGTMPKRRLERGEAFRTMTGAPIADCADTLVQLELTEPVPESGGSLVEILRAVKKGTAIQRKGEDVAAGQPLLPRGTRIGAVELALLASQGISSLQVLVPPAVGVYSTGTEVRPLTAKLTHGQVFNSNTPMLAALIQEAGGIPHAGTALKDDPVILKSQLEKGLQKYDMLVTTGGVSVGDFDLTPGILEELGVKRLFWGVYMRPGTPVYVGVFQEKLVFALSGNPPAAFINAHVLLLPALRRVLKKPEGEQTLSARLLRAPIKKRVKHTRFFSGRLFAQDGQLWIDVGGDQSAGSLTRFVRANALARIGPEDDLQDGTLVQVELLRKTL